MQDHRQSVAYLSLRTTRSPHHDLERKFPIHPRAQFDFGRLQIQQALSIKEDTISTHHLRFRCVVYDDENEHDIAPMIYARVLSFNSVKLTRDDAGLNTGVTIKKSDGDVLLSPGDILQLTPTISLTFDYHYPYNSVRNDMSQIQRAEARYFDKQYHLAGRLLGVGGQGSVFVAVKQSSKRQFACKAVPIKQPEASLLNDRQKLAREYNIMKDLDHANIIALDKVICTTYNIFIFQELITGGDLLSYMDQQKSLSEPQAAVIVFQLLKAVEYLHANGVVHRDIKPENILVTSWRDGARVVLTDFGQARLIESTPNGRDTSAIFRMQSIVGTSGYVAPEIFKQSKHDSEETGYSKAVDMWSIGCVAGTVLSNKMLFPEDEYCHSEDDDDDSDGTSDQDWHINKIDGDPSWFGISRKAKTFVKGCLVKDADVRMTATEALSSGWLNNRHYRSEMQAAYDRAIADWKPREQTGELIEFIDTTNAKSQLAAEDYQPPTGTTSKHFQNPLQPVAIPPSILQKPPLTHAHQAAARSSALPPMSRDPKEASMNPPTFSLGTADNRFPYYASPMRATDFTQQSTASTAPLSIYNYLPPQTQYTLPSQSYLPTPPYNDSTQASTMLTDPTQGRFRPLNFLNTLHSTGQVDHSQQSTMLDALNSEDAGRAKKKVYR